MFQFVPRKVLQKSQPCRGKTPTLPHIPFASSSTSTLPSTPPNTKGKSKSTDDDLVTLLHFALSDHSLWSNIDLRRTVANAQDGWIPLSYLFHHSVYLSSLHDIPSETAFARAARAHGSEVEVRMHVGAPDKGVWYGKGAKQDAGGGYEVRRKDTAEALVRARNSTRHEWDAQTVYLEGLPPAYRSISGVYHLASSLLDPSSPLAATTQVQAVTFIPHHHDRPSNQQKPGFIKPKPFVLVTFLTPAAAQQVTADWPWLPRRTAPPQGHDEVEEVREGARFGLRALTKARWEEMKEEYLEYRRQLLGEANGMDGRTVAASQISPTHPHQQELARSEAAVCDEVRDDSSAPPPTHISPNAPYPPGCLLFVRNVHAETNKTTLKVLLAAHAPSAARGVDYVDYNKGMISCHIRVSSPAHARVITDAFSTRPIVQQSGLDGAGFPPTSAGSGSDGKPVQVEVVTGEREAVYWDKVPVKVKRDAVRRAIAEGKGGTGAGEDGEEKEREEVKRARKRRRRG